MAFPTGSGSERLKYTKIAALTNTNQALITGVALHIYTVVSIIWCEEGNQADELINLLITDTDGSSNPLSILNGTSIGAYDTFVWNDRFSFDGTQKLMTGTAAAANIDVVCTFLDQDWT